MKKIFVFILLLCLSTFTQAKKVAILQEVSRPDAIAAGNNRLYISEGASVYIYTLKDYHLEKKFGKKGEGPREFNVSPVSAPLVVYPYNNKIYISSVAKLSVFTKDGEYIKETKVLPNILCIPIGNGYVGTGTTVDEKNQQVSSVNFYNEKFEKVRELYATDLQIGPSFTISFPFHSSNFISYKDRIYLAAGKEGFVIDVYDANGIKLYRIKKDYQPLKLTAAYKKNTENWFKTHPVYKQVWDALKSRVSYKDYFPAFRDILVSGDRIYVLTYKMQNHDTECIVMDLQGNEQKRVFLPCPRNLGLDLHPKYTTHHRDFYTLVENEEKEAWELHKKEIK
jgi:hypothetical protein